MKTLSRDAIQRMTGRGTSGNSGGGGGGSVDLTGYATESWVNENYLSIEFFSSLFKAYDSASTPNEIVPNGGDTSAITNVKAMFGFWTEQYLSALGQNSGGGGGGSSTLSGLVDVNISNPTDGQSLVYDATSQKWVNGAGVGNYLPLTGGTMANTNLVTNMNADLLDGKHASKFIYQTAINSYDDTAGFIITDVQAQSEQDSPFESRWGVVLQWSSDPDVIPSTVNQHNWVYQLAGMTSGRLYFRSRTNGGDWSTARKLMFDTDNIASSTKLQTARTLWGQSFDGTANVSGNMTGVGTISANGNNAITKTTGEDAAFVATNSNGSISLLTSTNRGVYDNTGNGWLIYTNGTNTMLTRGNVGIGTSSPAYKLDVDGTINCTSIRIGGYLITADSVNGGLHLNNGGFWADTFISALGLNSSGGGGGGSSTLAGLNDVSLSNPSNGQILQYNGTHWVNANAPQTGVTSVAAGTGLTTNITGGGAITSTGTISLSSATQTDIAKGVTAYGWGNHALAGYAQNSALNNYLPLAGGTMRGVITLGHSTTEGSSYSSAISVAIRTTSGTRADTYTYGNWIHGGEDHADQDGANIQIGTWFGFGIYPTISGMTRTQGKNSFWHNARTGNTYTWGNFYCYDGTNNNKVATENWVNGAYLPLAGGTMTGTLRLLTGSSVGIEASDNAGLLVYKPESGWNGVSNTQWAVGALSAQGVIRSNDNSLLHYNGTNNYKIWDENNDGSGSGLDADLLDGIHAKDMLIHYQLPRNVTASTYWHKLGEYETGGDNSNLILEVYSGSGYNSTGNQNSWAKIILKDGWQDPNSETGVGPTNSVGVSVEEYGYYSTGIKVIVVATAHNKGAVWVQLPWQYAVGDYVVYGRYTSWTHNNSIESDTTTAPTSNQKPVYYYRNLSYLNNNGQEAVTLPHDLSVRAGTNGATVRIGNMLLSYDATNKALKIEHQGSNGVEAGNIYATGAVSALGANTSGGGGGGGASTLSDLLDVALSSLSNGQVLTYDNATGKWVNAAVPTPSMAGYATENWVDQNYLKSVAFSDLTSHPTTLSGYGITDAKIQNGTITLGSNTITPLTSVAFNDLTSYPTTLSGYGITDAKIDSGTITLGSNTITPLTSVAFNDLTSYPTTLSGYGITDAKIQNGTITLGSNTITPLTSVAFNDLTSHPTTIAGYGITDAKFGTDGTGYVPITLGSTTKNVLTSHQTITDTMINTALGFTITGTAGTTYNLQGIANYAVDGETAYGWGDHAQAGYMAGSTTFWGQSVSNGSVSGSIEAGNDGGALAGFHGIEFNTHGSLSGYGGFIDFHFNGSSSDYTSRIIEETSGVVRLYGKLQIGDAVIEWDSANQCLKITGSVYATGGVTALG